MLARVCSRQGAGARGSAPRAPGPSLLCPAAPARAPGQEDGPNTGWSKHLPTRAALRYGNSLGERGGHLGGAHRQQPVARPIHHSPQHRAQLVRDERPEVLQPCMRCSRAVTLRFPPCLGVHTTTYVRERVLLRACAVGGPCKQGGMLAHTPTGRRRAHGRVLALTAPTRAVPAIGTRVAATHESTPPAMPANFLTGYSLASFGLAHVSTCHSQARRNFGRGDFFGADGLGNTPRCVESLEMVDSGLTDDRLATRRH